MPAGVTLPVPIKRPSKREYRMSRLFALLALVLPLGLGSTAHASDTPKTDAAAAPASDDKPKEDSSVTRHSVSVGGQSIKYTATAGTLLIRDDKDEPTASMFYVAYTRDGADAVHRPVTF